MRVIDTEKLEKLKAFLHDYAVRNNGDMPTLTEVMDYMDMAKATAYRYIVRLSEDGEIGYSGKGTLTLKEKSRSTRKYRSVRVPIYGSIICGSPEEEEQYNEGYLAVPEEWVEGECFLLRARGDSMIDIGVNEGDLVLIKKAVTAADGQVIAALTENGNTLKRLRYEGSTPVLLAENRTYPDERSVLHPRRLEIQGIALKIIKDVR